MLNTAAETPSTPYPQAIATNATHPPTPNRWLEVLVDCPLVQAVLTYQVAADLDVRVGDIVSVPLQQHLVGGIALRWAEQLPAALDPAQVRPVRAIVASGFLPADYLQVLDRIARYYCTPLIAVARAALPPGLLGRSRRRLRLQPAAIPPEAAATLADLPAQAVWQFLCDRRDQTCSFSALKRAVPQARRGVQQLVALGWVEEYLAPPRYAQPKRQQAVILTAAPTADCPLSPRRRELLQQLKHWGGEMWRREFQQRSRTTPATVQALAAAGYLVIEEREVLRLASGSAATGDRPKTLNPEQANALAAIQAQTGFARILLHGVTGSGKTEVYLQAIAPRLARGQSALVLVPEIGLTPQLTDRFRARFGDRVCVYHSALSEGERYDTWRQMLTGRPQVIIGTRSAVFAPLPHLGAIVLDEEHDSSFKQAQPMPTYHARTAAVWRAQLADCPLILGSATPALESWLAATTDAGWQYLRLAQRVEQRPLPAVEVVDMRRELQAGNRSIFSQRLRDGLHAIAAAGQKAILFIPRRGHSSFVKCRSCGFTLECPHCSVSLSYHLLQGQHQRLKCHYCNHSQANPSRCPQCDSPYIKFFGTGTQRVIQALAAEFPELTCQRFDSDTTQRKDAHRDLLQRFATGDIDVLVGTQMLTKGIDIPQVTLVGILAADGQIERGDYYASERAFQMLTQVAGRAGRGALAGRAILQTYSPEHPAIAAIQTHDYERFARATLQQRQQSNYPPYCRLWLLRFSGLQAVDVETAARDVAAACPALLPAGAQLLGPTPASVARVARRYRWQILLKLPLDAPRPDLMPLRALCPAAVRFSLDIDPLTIE